MSFAYGSGTEADPYQVWTPADLDNVRNYLNSYFIQMANINLSEYSNWVPIGTSSAPFTGQYDGNEKIISNLKINSNASSQTFVGLFGYIKSATAIIQRLTITNAQIVVVCPSSSVGIIVGRHETGNILNCKVNGDIDVTGSSNWNYIGGIAGQSDGSIKKSKATVNIHNSGTATGAYACGGISGFDGVIEECSASGFISIAASSTVIVGGLVGYFLSANSKAKNCYSFVNCTADRTGQYFGKCGGFIGQSQNPSITLENCYSVGTVTVDGGSDVGGFIGVYFSGTLISCYYNASTTGRTDTKGSSEYKTTTEMKDIDTYAGWDFEKIWAIHPDYNDGYPYFIWEWSPAIEPPIILDTVPAYSPQSIVNLVFQAGDSAEYPMGKFYVDRMQYSVNTESMRIDARNSIGKYLKDQTFDERNSYEVTKVSDMLEAILSGAGLSDYYVQPNNTYLGMEFAPNKEMLGGIEEVVQYIENWQIREEVSGRVVIADKTSSEFTQPSRYTFQRDRDIFSRDVSADDRSVYARVCVHTADFSVKVYRPVNTNLGWNAPANKTLYQTVPDGTTSYEAAGIAVKLAESMANSGAIETFVCAFRPQIIPGDEAEILEEDESATMLGIITQVKHSFGTGGFFTEIVVDSGGRIGKPRLKEIIGTLAPPPASKRL